MDWSGRNVLVTGGASFIGSHLVDALVDLGARVRVVDDLSSGRLENIARQTDTGRIEFTHADLREPGVARNAMKDINFVFHLAADHGGRGYVVGIPGSWENPLSVYPPSTHRMRMKRRYVEVLNRPLIAAGVKSAEYWW